MFVESWAKVTCLKSIMQQFIARPMLHSVTSFFFWHESKCILRSLQPFLVAASETTIKEQTSVRMSALTTNQWLSLSESPLYHSDTTNVIFCSGHDSPAFVNKNWSFEYGDFSLDI